MTEKKHIGVEIFNILKLSSTILQKELIRLLEDKGFKKHKIYLYLRYILVIPIPLEKSGFLGIPYEIQTEPMISRRKDEIKNEICIELNEEWNDVDEKSVIDLFDKYNPDKY